MKTTKSTPFPFWNKTAMTLKPRRVPTHKTDFKLRVLRSLCGWKERLELGAEKRLAIKRGRA